jgi:hypothetical protein
LLLLPLLGCPNPKTRHQPPPKPQSSAPAGTAGAIETRTVAVAFSATESDAWTSEMIDALGAKLGLDLWQHPSAEGNLDVYGPYQVHYGDLDLKLAICLCGFTGVVDIPGQEALGEQVRVWLDSQHPEAVWLDGDPLQFQVGRHLPAELPIIFSGVVLDRALYYTPDQLATGVYRRHSLPRILGEIWRADSEAHRYAFLSDDSPISLGRVKRFSQLAEMLPEGQEVQALAPATSWAELRQQIADLGDGVDAAVICGAGQEGAAPDFVDNPSLKIKPAAAAGTALDQLVRVLKGADPRAIPVVTPDDMAEFLAVGEETSEPGAQQEAAAPADAKVATEESPN